LSPHLELRDDVMIISVFYEEKQLDIRMNCATTPEDGKAIAEAIWEHLEPPNDWKLFLDNGDPRPDDHCLEHHERLQIRPISEIEPKFKQIKFQGQSFSIPFDEDPTKFLQFPTKDLYVSGNEIVARGNGGMNSGSDPDSAFYEEPNPVARSKERLNFGEHILHQAPKFSMNYEEYRQPLRNRGSPLTLPTLGFIVSLQIILKCGPGSAKHSQKARN
jgi:hypothetical protein